MIKFVQVQTTTACNARCRICPHHSFYGNKPVRVMSSMEFERIVKLLQPLRGQLKHFYPYFQNEPLCDSELFEKLDCFANYFPEAEVVLNTNLLMLRASDIERIKTSPIRLIHVSILGHTESLYKKNTGVPGLKKVMKNLKMLQQLTKTGIRIRLTAPGEEVNEDEFRATFERFGFPGDLFPPFSRGGSVGAVKEYGTSYGCSFMGDRLSNWLHIRANGDVPLCCMDYTNDNLMGNVYEISSLEELFQSERYLLIQRRASGTDQPNAFICQKCEFGIRTPKERAGDNSC